MALVSLFWGLGWTAMKVVLNEMGPWTFRSICLLGGGASLLLLARAGGASLRVPAEDLKALAVTALINVTGWHILSAYGVSLLHSGRAAIIAYSQWAFFTVVQIFPANVAALSTLSIPVIGVFSGALILGEPVTWNELTALFLVLVSLGLTASARRRA